MTISQPNKGHLETFVAALLSDQKLVGSITGETCSEAEARAEDVPLKDLYAAAIKKFYALPYGITVKAVSRTADGKVPYTAASGSHRPMVILADLKFSYLAIAVMCGCAVGTVKSGLSRARAEMKAAAGTP